jgi:NADP-dependent 3-hydroxy acid dehydrogenase YdfG
MTDPGSAGPVVTITGAGRGIGREIALAFADTGARLVLAARTEPELERTRELVGERGAAAIVALTDVTDPEQTTAMAGAAIDAFGAIDVLVCNSGIAGPTALLWEIEPEQWRETMRVNVEGVYLCCRAVLPSMVARGTGSVIVIGSMTGKRPLHGRTPYSASKLALVGLPAVLGDGSARDPRQPDLARRGAGPTDRRGDRQAGGGARHLRRGIVRPLDSRLADGPADRTRRGGGRRGHPRFLGRGGDHRRGPQRLRRRRQLLSSAQVERAVGLARPCGDAAQ